MKVLPANATDDDILEVCRGWVDLVPAPRFAEAIDLLHVPTGYDQSQHWTPASLETYIGNYGSWEPLADGRVVKVTPPKTAGIPVDRRLFRPRADVDRLIGARTAGAVELDVPL